jgi:hypothetical protein
MWQISWFLPISMQTWRGTFKTFHVILFFISTLWTRTTGPCGSRDSFWTVVLTRPVICLSNVQKYTSVIPSCSREVFGSMFDWTIVLYISQFALRSSVVQANDCSCPVDMHQPAILFHLKQIGYNCYSWISVLHRWILIDFKGNNNRLYFMYFMTVSFIISSPLFGVLYFASPYLKTCTPF